MAIEAGILNDCRLGWCRALLHAHPRMKNAFGPVKGNNAVREGVAVTVTGLRTGAESHKIGEPFPIPPGS